MIHANESCRLQSTTFLLGFLTGTVIREIHGMWRFILVTFAFLGWSFYELSGGADYTPRTNSIQARALLDDVRPMARPVRAHVTQVAGTGGIAPAVEPVAQDTAPRKAAPGIEPGLEPGPQSLVTLASANADTLAAP